MPDGPQWFCHPFELTGDELDADKKPKREIVEMWYRDPVECVRELVGNPTFQKQGYKPIRVYQNFMDGRIINWEFSEMWTAEWWWKVQVQCPPSWGKCAYLHLSYRNCFRLVQRWDL